MINAILLCDSVEASPAGWDVMHVIRNTCIRDVPFTLRWPKLVVLRTEDDSDATQDWALEIWDEGNICIQRVERSEMHPSVHEPGILVAPIREIILEQHGRYELVLTDSGRVLKTCPIYLDAEYESKGGGKAGIFGLVLCDEREVEHGSVHLRGVKSRIYADTLPASIQEITLAMMIENPGDLSYAHWHFEVHPPHRQGVWRLTAQIEEPTVRGIIHLPLIVKDVSFDTYGTWEFRVKRGPRTLAQTTLEICPPIVAEF